MEQVASELLAIALSRAEPAAVQEFRWTTADLGEPRIDLEDDEALRRVLDRSA